MESEKGFRAEKAEGQKSLKAFFDEQIYPYFSDWEKGNLAIIQDIKFPKAMLQEEYDKLLKYDAATNKEGDFYNEVLVPFYMISSSDDSQSFKNMIPLLLEKAKVLGEVLHRDAFFRNTYDSLEAWRACAAYKDYRDLLKNLQVLPEGSEERVAGMSKELDEIWSRPEVERAFENAQADEHVESGMGENSMLVKMYREDSQPIPESEYEGYHELRPDLFPEKYEDHLKELEERRHPYRLKL